MIFTNLVQANLRTQTLGKVIEYYSQLDSINEEACEIKKLSLVSWSSLPTNRAY